MTQYLVIEINDCPSCIRLPKPEPDCPICEGKGYTQDEIDLDEALKTLGYRPEVKIDGTF